MAVAFLSHTERVRVVVDAFDNFSTHPEFPERARIALEQLYGKVCALADRIVVNSEATQHFIWERWRRDTLLVPNGVRPELFANVVPMELSGVERPIVGYAGKLGRRIDVALLRSLAENLRRGTIVLAGQSLNWRWMSAAIGHRRIQSVGDLHYSRLPNFLAACDVCIVPHRVGQGENGGDATKIYEYLAAGKPVVTTAIGGVGRFAGRIAIARSGEEFVDAVLAALRDANGVPRGGVLPSEHWGARVRSICEYFGVGQRRPNTSEPQGSEGNLS